MNNSKQRMPNNIKSEKNGIYSAVTLVAASIKPRRAGRNLRSG